VGERPRPPTDIGTKRTSLNTTPSWFVLSFSMPTPAGDATVGTTRRVYVSDDQGHHRPVLDASPVVPSSRPSSTQQCSSSKTRSQALLEYNVIPWSGCLFDQTSPRQRRVESRGRPAGTNAQSRGGPPVRGSSPATLALRSVSRSAPRSAVGRPVLAPATRPRRQLVGRPEGSRRSVSETAVYEKRQDRKADLTRETGNLDDPGAPHGPCPRGRRGADRHPRAGPR
jgi:hypothetical protein